MNLVEAELMPKPVPRVRTMSGAPITDRTDKRLIASFSRRLTPHHSLSLRVRMTLSEGPGAVVVGVDVADDVAVIVVGAAEVGAAVLGPLPTGGVYCLVGGGVQVVVALVVVVDGGGGAGAAVVGTGAAVVGAVLGALEGDGGAGVDEVVAGAGGWFCED
jgi:hypothetical protein